MRLRGFFRSRPGRLQAMPSRPTHLAAAQDAALAPVRAALARRAAQEADAVVARSSQAARELIARAHAAVEASIAEARADGAAQARPVAATDVARSRRAARSAVLAAERADTQQLAARIRAAVLGLRDIPSYPALRDQLAELAREVAGPGAVLSEDQSGGVIARAPGVVVDCSLSRLADQVVVVLGARIAELCRL